jgi:hypothetical protein
MAMIIVNKFNSLPYEFGKKSRQIEPDASAPSVCTHERLSKVSDLKVYKISPDFKFSSGPERSATDLLRDDSVPSVAPAAAAAGADDKGVEAPGPPNRVDSSGVVPISTP